MTRNEYKAIRARHRHDRVLHVQPYRVRWGDLTLVAALLLMGCIAALLYDEVVNDCGWFLSTCIDFD